MVGAVLFDACTLQNWAIAGRLDVLERCYGYRKPHWTEQVRQEIHDGLNLAGEIVLRQVLNSRWLGDPWQPQLRDMNQIARLQIGLNDGRRPAVKHGGEAESIYFCRTNDGLFVTDDGPAKDFARRSARISVIDTVDILQGAVADGEITSSEAGGIAKEILQAGRPLRINSVDEFHRLL